MITPVVGSVVVELVQSQPLLELGIRTAGPALERAERQVDGVNIRDVGLRIRELLLLCSCEVFLRRVVHQANDVALLVDRD